jgi:dynein heavy chain 1
LGGLYYPEAFVTATRQVVAARWQCSLEELTLAIELHDERGSSGGGGDEKAEEEQENAFVISNLTLEGASLEEGRLALSSGSLRSDVPFAWFYWHRAGQQHVEGGGGKKKQQTGKKKEALDVAAALTLPLYLDESRSTLVAQLALVQRGQQQRASIPAHQFAQRGVAFVAWRGVV